MRHFRIGERGGLNDFHIKRQWAAIPGIISAIATIATTAHTMTQKPHEQKAAAPAPAPTPTLAASGPGVPNAGGGVPAGASSAPAPSGTAPGDFKNQQNAYWQNLFAGLGQGLEGGKLPADVQGNIDKQASLLGD